MNLPVKYDGEVQIVTRKQEPRRNFRNSWGAKSEGIQAGDYVDGIILGFETNEFGSKNIVLKSFTHQGSQLMVWGCSSIQHELHSDEACTQMIFNPSDVVRIQYQGSYIGKKGRSAGKLIAIFTIDELIIPGFNLSQQDVKDIQNFQSLMIQKQPLAAYKQMPQQQVVQPQQYVPQNTYIQPAAVQQPAFKPFLKKARDDFDI